MGLKKFKPYMDILVKIIETLLLGVEFILRFLVSAGEALMEKAEPKRKYDAKFAPSYSLLSSWNYGFNLTGTKRLTMKDSYQNALISAPTGMGKSSVVVIPSLFTMRNSSFITHDPSGEIFLKSSGYLKAKGYDVKVLNFSRPEVSCGFNPLVRAKTNSDIQKIASMLVENALGGNGNQKDPFWTTLAVSLLTMLISVLKKEDSQFQNLYNVRHLLNQMHGSPESVDQLFADNADPVLFAEYKSFVSFDDKVISGVIATTKAALNIFSDPAVAKITSVDNLDMEGFRSKPTALFIQNSVADQKYFSVLTSVYCEQFFSYLMSRFPAKEEQDIFVLLDEASSLKLPTLQLAVSNVRKHRAGIMLVIQDFNQLVHSYGKNEAEAIRTNCFAKLYFSGSSLDTARELEQLLGKYEFKDKDKNKVVRPLMTNDEIRIMKSNRAILICGHHRPVKVKLNPYFKSSKFNQYSKLPPVNMEFAGFEEYIPLLPLKAPAPAKPKKHWQPGKVKA